MLKFKNAVDVSHQSVRASEYNSHHRHSGRISSVILAKRVAAPKKTKTTLRHKHLAVLPTVKRQMSHNVIIENLITNHNHMRKTVVAKIN